MSGDFGEGSPVVTTLSGKLVKNLTVNDTENRADWSIGDSFAAGSQIFGDREITAVSVPKNLTGAEFIQTACDSKTFTGDLGTFTAGADITVYVALDSRVADSAPDWLADWEKADAELTATSDLTFTLYKKNFASGTEVTLGTNGGNGNNTNYFVLVKPEERVLNGTLIKNLTVYDSENAGDWSIESDFGEGAKLFGDRDLTCTSLPASLAGAEYIRTACDSKLVTDDLAEMTAGAYMTVFVAIDTRVEPLPAWLSGWTNTGTSLTTSNDLTMNLYSRTLNVGEPLTLGTDGSLNESVNYIVLAKAGKAALAGDLNADGAFNTLDLVLLQKWILAVPGTTLPNPEAGDLYADGVLDVYDLAMMKRALTQG